MEVDERIRILVREDGSVDWEGAKASGVEVAKFGVELWERLNGKEESGELPSLSDLLGKVEAKTPDTEEIRRLQDKVDDALKLVIEAKQKQNDLREILQLRKLNAKKILPEEIRELRHSDQRVKEVQKQLKIYAMNLDMEKICEYINK